MNAEKEDRRADGGRLVPDALIEEVMVYHLNRGPLTAYRPKPTPVPWHVKVRIWWRLLLSRARWSVHDFLFPECRQEEDW